MKNCIIVINVNAGGYKNISFEKVEKCLGDTYSFTRFSMPSETELDLNGFDAVAVCGGDGTLGYVLNKAYLKDIDVFYFPAGTLNDKAKAVRYENAKTKCPSVSRDSGKKGVVVGRCDTLSEPVFGYVLAAGSFTPIGYTAEVKNKKKTGIFAYIVEAVKEYKIWRIPTKINADGKVFKGEFTLVMIIKSPRCFGFKFNKAYDENSKSGHLVAVRSPKHNHLLGKIEMFFLFFRVFFLGLKKERDGKIIFKRAEHITVTHEGDVPYCKDGEKAVLKRGDNEINFIRSTCGFTVIDKY